MGRQAGLAHYCPHLILKRIQREKSTHSGKETKQIKINIYATNGPPRSRGILGNPYGKNRMYTESRIQVNRQLDHARFQSF